MTLRAGLVLAVAAGVGLGFASPSQGAQKAIWGPNTLPGGGSAFPLYSQLGVDTVQYTLSWAGIATTRPAQPQDPADPAYTWPEEADQAVQEAGRYGIKVALLVIFTPRWANDGKTGIWAPTNPGDFADFMVAASRRYATVRQWMIWGEPDRIDHFQPNQAGSPEGPAAYATLLDAAYGALKQASVSNVVIGGMTWTGGDVRPADFLRWLRLPSGQPPRFDWYGHNPFPFRFPDLGFAPEPGGYRDISDTDTLAEELRDTFGREVPLWLSEFTIQSEQSSSTFELFVNRADQAGWLSAAYQIADRVPSVAGLGWLSLADQAGEQGAKWGLLDANGQPKPALDAYRLAPSQKFRPEVELPRRIRRGHRLVIRIRARIRGEVRVALNNASGRRAVLTKRRALAGRTTRVRLRTGRLAAGRYVVIVVAPRAERVIGRVSIR